MNPLSMKRRSLFIGLLLLFLSLGVACSFPFGSGRDAEETSPAETFTQSSQLPANPYPAAGETQTGLNGAYPYPGSSGAAATPYPAAGEPQGATRLPDLATPTIEGGAGAPYPPPGGQAQITLTGDPTSSPPGDSNPTATAVIVATSSPQGTVNPYPGPKLTDTPVFILTPTGTLAGAFITATSVDTATPVFLTPTNTPSPTPTPSPTATPLPPPWVLTNLRATDPRTVEIPSGKVQFIWFFAFWDGASQAMAPIVKGLEDQYAEQIQFIYLDIDDPATGTLKRQLGYRAQPHIFLLGYEGQTLKQWQGYVSYNEFRIAIDGALR